MQRTGALRARAANFDTSAQGSLLTSNALQHPRAPDRPARRDRPIADLRPTFTLLQAQPAFRSFAARAKSGDDRTRSLPDEV